MTVGEGLVRGRAQGGQQDTAGQGVEIAPGDLGFSVFVGDDLALFGDADPAGDRALGLGHHGGKAGAAAAA